MAKTYKIECTRTLNGTTRVVEGTIEYLVKYFKYTLECGHSYEYEKGNKKINMEPKTGKSLVTNLNKAEMNSSLHGYQSCSYQLIE